MAKRQDTIYRTGLKNMSSAVINQLTVIERAPNGEDGHAFWLCRCSCGKEKVISGKSLREGASARRNRATPALAAQLHECLRQLRGRWQATRRGAEMRLAWPVGTTDSESRRTPSAP